MQHLLDEQLSKKQMLYLVSMGTDLELCWSEPVHVSQIVLHQAATWILHLHSRGTSRLVQALQDVLTHKEQLDSIVLIMGDSPGLRKDLMLEEIEELWRGISLPLNTIEYDCHTHQPVFPQFLKQLVKERGDCYHYYSAAFDDQVHCCENVISCVHAGDYLLPIAVYQLYGRRNLLNSKK